MCAAPQPSTLAAAAVLPAATVRSRTVRLTTAPLRSMLRFSLVASIVSATLGAPIVADTASKPKAGRQLNDASSVPSGQPRSSPSARPNPSSTYECPDQFPSNPSARSSNQSRRSLYIHRFYPVSVFSFVVFASHRWTVSLHLASRASGVMARPCLVYWLPYIN